MPFCSQRSNTPLAVDWAQMQLPAAWSPWALFTKPYAAPPPSGQPNSSSCNANTSSSSPGHTAGGAAAVGSSHSQVETLSSSSAEAAAGIGTAVQRGASYSGAATDGSHGRADPAETCDEAAGLVAGASKAKDGQGGDATASSKCRVGASSISNNGHRIKQQGKAAAAVGSGGESSGGDGRGNSTSSSSGSGNSSNSSSSNDLGPDLESLQAAEHQLLSWYFGWGTRGELLRQLPRGSGWKGDTIEVPPPEARDWVGWLLVPGLYVARCTVESAPDQAWLVLYVALLGERLRLGILGVGG
jgi:hypothetical protein